MKIQNISMTDDEYAYKKVVASGEVYSVESVPHRKCASNNTDIAGKVV